MNLSKKKKSLKITGKRYKAKITSKEKPYQFLKVKISNNIHPSLSKYEQSLTNLHAIHLTLMMMMKTEFEVPELLQHSYGSPELTQYGWSDILSIKKELP